MKRTARKVKVDLIPHSPILEELLNCCTQTATAKPLPVQVLLTLSSFPRVQGAELTNNALLLQTAQTSDDAKPYAFTCAARQSVALTVS